MSKPAEHEPDYEHLAQCLRHARGGTSRREIADASGIAEPTIARYESGRPFRSIPSKMRRLAAHYRWTSDSIAECLRGGEPTVIPEVPPIPALSPDDRAALIAMVGASDLPSWARRHLLRVLLEGGDAGAPESPAVRQARQQRQQQQQPPQQQLGRAVDAADAVVDDHTAPAGQLPTDHPWTGTPTFPLQLPTLGTPAHSHL